ncbi:MAG: twin-arginine translocase TatA/TatE family subunit [Bifidobacteriaceae bacterium]|jgi:sec-independent protein translocase protein TatA|nr:twin-arginine translocase TatA/TatE family subunit [Bifidobacteriaceae bacterium]
MFRNGLQPSHVILILVVVLLLVGSTKLPALAKSLGQSLKIFKKEVEGLTAKNEDAPDDGGAPAGDAGGGSSGGTGGGSGGGSAGEPPQGPATTSG